MGQIRDAVKTAKFVKENYRACRDFGKWAMERFRRTKRVALFVDGENISYKYAEQMCDIARNQGKMVVCRVYTLFNDNSTWMWREVAERNHMMDVRLSGEQEKDKVDRKIQRDMRRLFNRNVDVICLATCDGGYAPTIQAAVLSGKKVVIIGEENKISQRLKRECSEMISLR